MSEDQSWPPPGTQPPPAAAWPPPPGHASPPPGRTPAPPAAWGPPQHPYQAPPVHRPGAVPLRPLGLGDMYDAAFKILRFNAGATIGAALLVSSVAMLVTVLGTVFVASAFDLSTDAFGAPMSETEVLIDFGSGVASMVFVVLQVFGLLFVTGMVALVAQAAAVGRRLSLAEAWALTHGLRWKLVGLTLLGVCPLTAYVALSLLLVVAEPGDGTLVLWFVVTVPSVIVLQIWAWVRLWYLAVPAMMIERLGVFRGLGRAFRLTSAQFWRTFGIALLTAVVTGVASSILAVPFSVGSLAAPYLVDGNTGAYVGLGLTLLGSVIGSAFVTPYQAAVSSLQYIDQRMRKEGYDVELLAEAGITPS